MKIRIVHTMLADWLYICAYIYKIGYIYTLYGVRIKTSRVSVVGTYMTSIYMLITY